MYLKNGRKTFFRLFCRTRKKFLMTCLTQAPAAVASYNAIDSKEKATKYEDVSTNQHLSSAFSSITEPNFHI